MSNLFRLRVDLSAEKSDSVLEWIRTFTTSFLLVSHTDMYGRNPHYHAWLCTKFVDITIRSYVRKLDPSLIGNKAYSLQSCDHESIVEYKTYLFNLKQGNIVRFIGQQGCEDWEQFRDASAKLTEEFNEKIKKTYSKNDCITDMLRLYSTDGEAFSPDHCFDNVIKATRRHGTVFSINAIRDVILYVSQLHGEVTAESDTFQPYQRTWKSKMRQAIVGYFDPRRT